MVGILVHVIHSTQKKNDVAVFVRKKIPENLSTPTIQAYTNWSLIALKHCLSSITAPQENQNLRCSTLNQESKEFARWLDTDLGFKDNFNPITKQEIKLFPNSTNLITNLLIQFN